MGKTKQPQVGQIVRVMRGRDAGKYAIIIEIVDSRFVMIADGDKRKFDQPKKKNIHHISLQDHISSEVVNSMLESGRVTNGKLRFALNRFIENTQTNAVEKGV